MATLEMNVRQVNSDFQAIKDKIVEHGVEVADGTKTAEYASKVDDVFEAGKKAEYDAFWDNFGSLMLDDGTIFADMLFAGGGWTADILKPPFDIIVNSCANMFANSNMEIDLVDHFEKLGKRLVLVNQYNKYGIFANSKFTRIGEVGNTHENGNCNSWFKDALKLKTIDKLYVPKGTTFSHSFTGCESLENLMIDGIIDVNSFNIQQSPKLSKASITSIINALSTTTSGLAVALSKTAVTKAFETSSGANDGNSSPEWLDLIGTRNNWTISIY